MIDVEARAANCRMAGKDNDNKTLVPSPVPGISYCIPSLDVSNDRGYL